MDYDVDKIDREVKCALVTSPSKANRKIADLVEVLSSNQSSISSPEEIEKEIESVQKQYDRDKFPPVEFVGRVVKYAIGNKTKISIVIPLTVAIEILGNPVRVENSSIVIEGV